MLVTAYLKAAIFHHMQQKWMKRSEKKRSKRTKKCYCTSMHSLSEVWVHGKNDENKEAWNEREHETEERLLATNPNTVKFIIGVPHFKRILKFKDRILNITEKLSRPFRPENHQTLNVQTALSRSNSVKSLLVFNCNGFTTQEFHVKPPEFLCRCRLALKTKNQCECVF